MADLGAAVRNGNIRDLDGLTAASAAIIITDVLAEMYADPARFVTLETENKYGTVADFSRWLERLLVVFREHPRAKVTVN